MGSGILQMIQADDVLRVDRNFSTSSGMSHATMLTNGRMELGRNFNQSGNAASFGSSDRFTIAFIGNGEHTAHFDNIEYSGFANIDVAHPNVVMTDDGSEAFDRLLFSIGRGLASGLQDALSIEELRDTVLGFMASYGISIAVGAVINPPLILAIIGVLAAVVSVISASFMVAQAIEGIYDTATSTGTVYQKAEAYAYDAVLLIMSVGAIIGAAKEVLNSIKTLRSVLEQLKGRKTRFKPEEVLENRPTEGDISADKKAVKKIYSFDDFVDCMQDNLDAASLEYVKQELGKDSDNLSFLNKVSEVIQSAKEVKDGPLELHEAKYITNSLFEGDSKDNILDVIRFVNGQISNFLDEDALKYFKEILDADEHDSFNIMNSIMDVSNAKNGILHLNDIKYVVNATDRGIAKSSICEFFKYISLRGKNEVELLLDIRQELTGNNRERLLTTVANSELATEINELYRPTAYTGDGGTADKLISEFFEGNSRHLQKANDKLKRLNTIAASGELNFNDWDVIDALILDLENAIKLFD